jgi:hypothetical protein
MNITTQLAVIFLLPAIGLAQETVAPTSGETTSSVRGDNHGDYNLVQSWELGYRFATVGGNDGKYRSDVNSGNGIRLLSGSFAINSRDGHGRWFDAVSLNTAGLGNDPYESATLRIEKNRWYRYDMLWRENDYFNPGLTTAAGEHLENTTFRMQDHEVTLLPQSWFRVRAGYSRTTQDGPVMTTTQQFDAQGDAFPLFSNLRQGYNEYRLGADVTRRSFRLSILRRWEFFREDSSNQLLSPVQGAATLFGGSAAPDQSALTSFASAQPYRGRTPGWLANLFAERKWLAVNARFTYSGGRGAFLQNTIAVGTNRFGGGQNQQVLVTGSGDRPVMTGDLNITLSPSSKLSVINTTSISNSRMTGNNSFEQFDYATLTSQILSFQYLGIRTVTNGTDVRYRFTKKFDAFAGFRYSERLIRSIEDSTIPGLPFVGITAEQTNHLRAGVAGFNWMPLKDLRVHAEIEIGSNDNPFAPVSVANYTVIRSRAQYRKKNYSLTAGYQENYNNNSIQITAYSSHSRNYTADASWSARSWLSFDASYSRLHLDTVGGLAFFAGAARGTLFTGQESIYLSNIHSGHLAARLPVTKYADVFIGYSITKDVGNGNSSAAPTGALLTIPASILLPVQTFPLTYQTPFIRLSVRINAKLRYNLGYQYYGYREDFGLLGVTQNYRANTGYTSLLWSF